MEPEEGTHEFVVTALHPGVTREQVVAATGWAIRFADQVSTTEAPTEVELTACVIWKPAPPPPMAKHREKPDARRIYL
jgi:hypothetical protein